MKGNDGNVGTGTGGISILAIFVVLCLTTLAALSLVSAQADYALAERATEASTEYYAADSRAEEKLAEIVGLAAQSDWQAALENKGYTVALADDVATVSFDETISDVKNLHVEIALQTDAAGVPTGDWSRQCWQSVTIPGNTGVQSLPVYT